MLLLLLVLPVIVTLCRIHSENFRIYVFICMCLFPKSEDTHTHTTKWKSNGTCSLLYWFVCYFYFKLQSIWCVCVRLFVCLFECVSVCLRVFVDAARSWVSLCDTNQSHITHPNTTHKTENSIQFDETSFLRSIHGCFAIVNCVNIYSGSLLASANIQRKTHLLVRALFRKLWEKNNVAKVQPSSTYRKSITEKKNFSLYSTIEKTQ